MSLVLGLTSRRLALGAFVVAAGVALAACGSGGSDKSLLTHSAASRLTATLNQVQRLVDDGDCQGAQAETVLLRNQVGALPSRVDASLREAVIAGANRLDRLIAGQCTAVTTTPAPATTPEQQPEENGNGKQKKTKKPKEQNGNGNGNGNGEGTSGPVGTEENPQGDSGTTDDGGSGGSGGDSLGF